MDARSALRFELNAIFPETRAMGNFMADRPVTSSMAVNGLSTRSRAFFISRVFTCSEGSCAASAASAWCIPTARSTSGTRAVIAPDSLFFLMLIPFQGRDGFMDERFRTSPVHLQQ